MDLPHHASEERDYIAMRTLTVVRQYLAAGFLIMLGLIAYGCGDSATVNPVVELASLTVDPGALQPAFSGGTTQYNVDVSNNITSVTITAQPAVAGDSVTINGQATTSSVIPLGAAGTTTPVNIVVSESGTNSRTYTVLFVRAGLTGNNSLQNLAVSPGPLDSPFTENDLNYSVDVANTVGSITVTPTLSDPAATMTVNGQATNSGQARTITLNPAGQSTNIPIVVTAQNGNPKTYQVTVSRGVSGNNNLQGLTVSPGPLNPTFNANRTSTSYTVNVASTVTSITVTPRVQDPAATMTVTPPGTISGQARTITLNGAGSNTFINIVVTAQNGSQKTYSVNVQRAALGGNNNLSGLTVSPGPLTPVFAAATTNYTVDVASTVGSITVTPRLQAPTADPTATMTVNGQPTTSGQARTITPLNPAGQNTLITIQVTAPNTISQKTYTVNVIRAALSGNNNLQNLTVRSHTLVPPFSQSRARTDYDLSVINSVDSITVDATPPTGASVRFLVNGSPTGTNSIPLPPGPSTTEIEIFVRAPNGIEKPYSITVTRAAASSNNNLSALRVNGSSVPGFTQETLDYTVNVASGVNEVTVSATKADRDATMAVGSVTVPPGTPTGQTTVPVSASPISIAVTAPGGGAPRTYTVTVRQGPPAPTVAPDLLRDDDTCPPGIPPAECAPDFNGNPTSREDNVTTVTTPGFSIPQPGSGETAKLYKNGVEEPSSFNPGDNTLRPNAALDDGVYNITYTITNAVGESGPSPVMTPQLRIDTTPLGGGGSTQ